MLNKVAENMITMGYVFMTEVYTEKGINYISYYVEYLKELYHIQLEKGKKCISIKLIRE